jgi:DNA-binding NarL/FixJ family response regulator
MSNPRPPVDREAVRRLVLSRPIPDKLIANLARYRVPERPRKYADRETAAMTPALWETLKLLAAGYSTPRIAVELGVPHAAAHDRVRRLLAYFDARDRIDVVVRCYREGIM